MGHPFDPTLLKYKPRHLGRNATAIDCPELFKRFTDYQFKEKGLAPGSMRRYICVQAHAQKRLNVSAESVGDHTAGNFTAQLMEHVSERTVKEYLWLLKSSWDWAKGKYHVSDKNPWTEPLLRVRIQPRQRVKPFTAGEVRAIIGAFRISNYYSHYADFVVFLFGAGCRIGEAVGLQWKHIADDYQTVWIGESVSDGVRRSTKTGKARTVTIGDVLGQMLCDRRKRLQPKPDDLVFPAPSGKPINRNNFSRRAWKTILEQCHIEYRKPYSTRHTAISHALANGANYMQVEASTGHDPRILHQSYASVIEQKSVFVEF